MKVDLPVFLYESRDLQLLINTCRSVRLGCIVAEMEARIILRTRLSEAQGHRCCWCGTRFSDSCEKKNSPTLEHVRPRSLGGSDCEDNLAVACKQCNTRRGTLPVDDFLAYLEKRARS